MRVAFDTEFYHRSRNELRLLSIGAVREDGEKFYALAPDFKETLELIKSDAASGSGNAQWLLDNVLQNDLEFIMRHDPIAHESYEILGKELEAFCGDSPQFWAYIPAFDMVVKAGIYGSLIGRPSHWPYTCNDLAVPFAVIGRRSKDYPMNDEYGEYEHNALGDAIWTMRVWNEINKEYVSSQTVQAVLHATLR